MFSKMAFLVFCGLQLNGLFASDIDGYVAGLGDEDYYKREAAEKEVYELGKKDVLLFQQIITKASRSENPEVVNRSASLRKRIGSLLPSEWKEFLYKSSKRRDQLSDYLCVTLSDSSKSTTAVMHHTYYSQVPPVHLFLDTSATPVELTIALFGNGRYTAKVQVWKDNGGGSYVPEETEGKEIFFDNGWIWTKDGIELTGLGKLKTIQWADSTVLGRKVPTSELEVLAKIEIEALKDRKTFVLEPLWSLHDTCRTNSRELLNLPS